MPEGGFDYLAPVGLEVVLLAVERRDVARHGALRPQEEADEVERPLLRLRVVKARPELDPAADGTADGRSLKAPAVSVVRPRGAVP